MFRGSALVKLSDQQERVLAFVESYAKKFYVVPSFERIREEFKDVTTPGALTRTFLSLKEHGFVDNVIFEIKEAKRKEREGRPERYFPSASRSGVHELSRKELEVKAYLVQKMDIVLPDGVEWQFLFTVDRKRGKEELQKVNTVWAEQFSPYGESLVEGMFRKWHTEAQ